MKQDFLYGIIGYNSINIGDEIQDLAAMRFLPQVDEVVYREQINSFVPKSEGKLQTKLIMNAWWMWKPENFLPSGYIEPLLVSMHIRPEIQKQFMNKKVKKYLTQKGPVGCRDMNTYRWLKEENIPAYFSGCLTTTLLRNPNIPRENYILCVDVSKEYVDEIKKYTSRPVYTINRMMSPCYSFENRLELAKLTLRAYHNAHLVISPRLHVITPCLAMETPVLRLITNEIKSNISSTSRYEGMEHFFNTVEEDDFIELIHSYDFEHPKQNPQNHLEMRNNLIKICSEFTGFDSQKSILDEYDNPLVKTLQINEYSPKIANKMLYFAPSKELKRTWIKRKLGYTKFHLVDGMKLNMKKNSLFLKLKLLKYNLALKNTSDAKNRVRLEDKIKQTKVLLGNK